MDEDVIKGLEEIYRKGYTENLLEIFKKVDINTAMVYIDLRKRGYRCLIKDDKKILIFEKGGNEIEYECYIFSANEKMKWKKLSNIIEKAGKNRRKLLIAVVDSEGDVTYYVARKRRF